MPRFKSKISTLLKSKKINILLVFVLLALLFSLLTKLSKDYTKTIVFDVDMVNVPDEHIILKDSTHKINVTVSTYGFNLLKYYFVDPKLKVDFASLKKETNYYLWTKNSEFQNVVNQFNVATRVNSISPDTINFEYDSYSVKTIPVELVEDIKYALGFDIEDAYHLKPDSIKIIGASTVIDTIAKIKTELLAIKNVNSDINADIKLKLPLNSEELKFSESNINVSGTVKKFTEGSVSIPITVTNLPKDVVINFFPKEAEVTFYTSLDNYKTISVNGFKVECDYSTINNQNNKLFLKITKQPDKVRNVRLGTKAIEFIIL